jgi:septal ring factor EnvC (AmiA/AmiB activator)
MTVTASSKSQVVAPASARVEFAGDFKNYDKVVILNMDDGYFLLLTGLGETFPETGEIVSAGQPLGLMPFNPKNKTELYIELRKDGATINPKPWLGTAFASTQQ